MSPAKAPTFSLRLSDARVSPTFSLSQVALLWRFIPRHEQSSVFAVEGYARSSGKPIIYGAFWIASEFVSAAVVAQKCLRIRVNWILKCSETPSYMGFKRVEEDTYDEVGNPGRVIQLGLAQNKLSLDLVKNWVAENAEDAIVGRIGSDEIACYQPFMLFFGEPFTFGTVRPA